MMHFVVPLIELLVILWSNLEDALDEWLGSEGDE